MGGAPDSCAGAVLSGNYLAGSPTTSSNTVLLQVHVDSIGPYSVTTDTINGFSFSGSGTYTNTGTQVIKLAAHGTPSAAGYSKLSVLHGMGCSFTVPVISTTTTTSCTGFNVYGPYNASVSLLPSDSVVVQINVTAIGSYNITTDTVNGIYFSASGTFTKTGSQNLTLKGTGTPTASGSFSYTLKFGNTGCSFVVLVNGGVGSITATIDNATPGKTFNYLAIAQHQSPNGYSVTGITSPNAKESLTFIITNKNGPLNSSVTNPGQLSTYSTADTTNGQFVSVTYTDANGVMWDAYTGQNPTFTITINNITTTSMDGYFSGTVKRSDLPTLTKTITGGNFNVPIQ